MKTFINKYLLSEQTLMAVLVLLLVPLFVLCFYIHPSADDFYYSSWYRSPVPISFLKYHLGNYLTWNGRYFSTVLLTVNPLVFGSFTGYKILPVFLIIFFYSSLFYFFKNLFNSLTNRVLHIISLLLTITYLNIVPSLPETVYWMPASITYFFTWGLTFYLLVFLLKYHNELKNKKKNTLLSFIIAFCVIGSNELSAFLVVFFALLIFIYEFVVKKSIRKFSVWFLVFTIIFILIVVLAPGNNIRLTSFNNHYNLYYALISTFKNVIKIFVYHIKYPSFIVFCLLALINTPNLIAKSVFFQNNTKINLKIIPLLIVAIIAFFYFTSAFNLGIEPFLRVHCYVGLFLIISLSLYIMFLNSKTEFIILQPKTLKRLNIIMFILFISFIITDFHKKAGEDLYIKGNIVLAMKDIVHDAPRYDIEMKERYKLIAKSKNEKHTTLTVPALSVKPQSIFFVDIKSDSSNWINCGYTHFFEMDYIRTNE